MDREAEYARECVQRVVENGSPGRRGSLSELAYLLFLDIGVSPLTDTPDEDQVEEVLVQVQWLRSAGMVRQRIAELEASL